MVLILAIFGVLTNPVQASDWRHVCDVLALHHEWECNSVKSPDLANFCNANINMDDDDFYCPEIKDPDLRHLCEATAQAQARQCDQINSGDIKHICDAIAQLKLEECELVQNSNLQHFCRAISQNAGDECLQVDEPKKRPKSDYL